MKRWLLANQRFISQNRWNKRIESKTRPVNCTLHFTFYFIVYFFFRRTMKYQISNSQSHYLISQKHRKNNKEMKNETEKGSKLIFGIQKFLFELNSMVCALYCVMWIRRNKNRKTEPRYVCFDHPGNLFISIGILKSGTFTHLQTEDERWMVNGIYRQRIPSSNERKTTENSTTCNEYDWRNGSEGSFVLYSHLNKVKFRWQQQQQQQEKKSMTTLKAFIVEQSKH